MLEPHPHLPILATSGLDHDVKVFYPTANEAVDIKDVERVSAHIISVKYKLLDCITRFCAFSDCDEECQGQARQHGCRVRLVRRRNAVVYAQATQEPADQEETGKLFCVLKYPPCMRLFDNFLQKVLACHQKSHQCSPVNYFCLTKEKVVLCERVSLMGNFGLFWTDTP